MNHKLKNGTDETFTFDAENQLTQFKRVGTGAMQENYVYDADGNRVKVTRNSSLHTYQPFPHYQVDNGTVEKYYYFGGQRIAMLEGSTFIYLHNDHLGSPALTTSGTISSTLKFYAYGKPRSSSGTQPTRYQFTGQYQDDSGLTYMNARYYDSDIGTFISADTIVPSPGAVVAYNRYAYANLNPMGFVDPSGHFSEEQLDHLGISKDSVSADVWKLLLALEPLDQLVINGQAYYAVIANSMPVDQDQSLVLGVADGQGNTLKTDPNTPLSLGTFLMNYGSSLQSKTVVNRMIVDVQNGGYRIASIYNYGFVNPRYAHSSQTMSIVSGNDAVAYGFGVSTLINWFGGMLIGKSGSKLAEQMSPVLESLMGETMNALAADIQEGDVIFGFEHGPESRSYTYRTDGKKQPFVSLASCFTSGGTQGCLYLSPSR